MIERIYIPTVRRAGNQITYNHLPAELKERVIMVVEPGERHLYKYPCEYLVIPTQLVGTWTQLAETRLLIHKHAGAIKYCIADDDSVHSHSPPKPQMRQTRSADSATAADHHKW